jgi:uncharacterized damage-inducible protein DinB
MNTTESFFQAYQEARTRLDNVCLSLTASDLQKRLDPGPNSAGFLLRHIGDVELLFAKNVFELSDVDVRAKTVIEKKDSGVWTNLEELNSYLVYSFEQIKRAIELQKHDRWSEMVETKEFGKKTRAEAFGRIISHTAYHAGQLAMIVKYGKGQEL